MNISQDATVRHLQRPDGRIAYTVEGEGPLAVALPGMGDLRGSYRDLVGPLVAAGHRVAVADLRGHGDSDVGFRVHGDDVTGRDLLALIDELGGPAVVIGNSMAGSAAVWAAAERPDAIAGLVLVSPFLGGSASAASRAVFRLVLARPWGVAFWTWYYERMLNRGTRAPWLGEHVAAIRASLREPGRLAALRSLTAQLDHSIVAEPAARVAVPSLIVVGELDPDYRDPAAELARMTDALGGPSLAVESLLAPAAAHYPHAQRPDVVVPRVLEFLAGICGAEGGTRA